MRNDGISRRHQAIRRLVVGSLGLLLAPALARAAQTDIAVQYSRFEQPVFRVNPDGSYRKSILTTESWLQTVTVRGSARPRPSLALSSEVRWSSRR